jgi:O-antigen/teichoic acid export membrane protein
VGNTGRQILQFAFGIALARLLVPADFGMIATIQVFTGFVAMMATGGMGQSLIRAKEASTEDFSAVFTLQLGLGVLIYAAFFLSAPLIARYFENPLYADLLRVSALIFILRPFTLIRVSWLTREMAFKKSALVDLTASMLTWVSSVAMALVGMGVWSLAPLDCWGLWSGASCSFTSPLCACACIFGSRPSASTAATG